MNMVLIASDVNMQIVRHRAALQSLWWLAVGATMLCSCEGVIADPAHVGPWRGGGGVGYGGVPATCFAPTANVAQNAANSEGTPP